MNKITRIIFLDSIFKWNHLPSDSGDDSNWRQCHPSRKHSRWGNKYHFVKLHSKMIWLVIFHWFKWLRWEVRYYFYPRVRESLRPAMSCQPCHAKHSCAWCMADAPESPGAAGFFQPSRGLWEICAPQGLRKSCRSSGNSTVNVTATFCFCTHRLESSENISRWDSGFE